MARTKSEPLYIAVGGHAVALDARTGNEIWRTKLKSSGSYSTIARHGDLLLAASSGEIFCLDPRTGAILWHNKLKGLGMGVVAFPGSDVSSLHAAAAAQTAATSAAV